VGAWYSAAWNAAGRPVIRGLCSQFNEAAFAYFAKLRSGDPGVQAPEDEDCVRRLAL